MNLTKSNHLTPQAKRCSFSEPLSLLARLSYDLSFDLMENYETAEEDEDNN